MQTDVHFSLDAPDPDPVASLALAHHLPENVMDAGGTHPKYKAASDPAAPGSDRTFKVVFVIPGFVPKHVFVAAGDKDEACRKARRENPTAGLITCISEVGGIE